MKNLTIAIDGHASTEMLEFLIYEVQVLQEEARKIQKKIAKNKFGLDDFMKQIQQD